MKYKISKKHSEFLQKIHEECGVFGIAAAPGDEINAAAELLFSPIRVRESVLCA